MAKTIWLQTDTGKNGGQFLIDADTRVPPTVISGNGLQIFLGAFRFDKPLDLSGYEYVNLIIREGQTDDTAAMVDTNVLAVDITSPVTLTAWNNRNGYNATITVAAGEMEYDLGAETQVTLWMVLTARNDTSGAETVLGSANITMFADNNAGTAGGAQYMLKEVYDTNGNNKVDLAELAEAVAWDDVTGKPATFAADLTGAIRYDAVQALTSGQKTQARDNIGAGTLSDLGAALLYTSQSLTAGQKTQALTNLGINTLSLDGALRYDEVQALSAGEKTQAQENLGISGLSLDGAVLYSGAQALNASQKQQARDNIDAISSANLDGAVLYDQVLALSAAEKAVARANIGASESASEVTEQVVIFRKDIDTVLGATTNCLQDISWSGLTPVLPTLYAFIEASSGELKFYELESGTAVADGVNTVLPNDYNDPVNDYYWRLVVPSPQDLSPYLKADGTVESTGAQTVNNLLLNPNVSVDITTGAVAYAKNNMVLDTESAAAADSLVTMTGASSGQFCFLRCADAARVITVTHSLVANGFRTWDATDIVLDDPKKELLVKFNGTYWTVVNFTGASGGGGGGVPFDDSVAQLINEADNTKKIQFNADNITTATTRQMTFRDSDAILGITTKEYQLYGASLTPGETELLFVATRPGTIHWIGGVVDDIGTEALALTLEKNGSTILPAVTDLSISGAAASGTYGVGLQTYSQSFVSGDVFSMVLTDPGEGSGSGAIPATGPVTLEVAVSYEEV